LSGLELRFHVIMLRVEIFIIDVLMLDLVPVFVIAPLLDMVIPFEFLRFYMAILLILRVRTEVIVVGHFWFEPVVILSLLFLLAQVIVILVVYVLASFY
jgi:hypothetical protein